MQQNQKSSIHTLDTQLHLFLCKKNQELTQQWFATLDESAGGFYREADPNSIAILKQLNREFHNLFCSLFEGTNPDSMSKLRTWIDRMDLEQGHLALPLEAIIKELFKSQKQYLQLVKTFVSTHEEQVPHELLLDWNQSIVDIFNDIVMEFSIANTKMTKDGLYSQQETIAELSAPVILVAPNVGLLPLIGEITEQRATDIFENVLKQCYDKSLVHLFIDLSGVPVIDTMVAQRIFQLIDGLKLIGVQVAIAGVSPVIAQTAIQLGIKFDEIDVYNKLEQAMKVNVFSSFQDKKNRKSSSN